MKWERHGHTNPQSPTYNSWQTMIQRCTNPNNPKYRRYGARGVEVCGRWMEFPNFLADMGVRPEGMTLGRRDNDGDYEPSNCRWETNTQQANNKSNNVLHTKDGVSKTLPEWSRELGVSTRALYYRLNNHGTIFI